MKVAVLRAQDNRVPVVNLRVFRAFDQARFYIPSNLPKPSLEYGISFPDVLCKLLAGNWVPSCRKITATHTLDKLRKLDAATFLSFLESGTDTIAVALQT